ncbi:hypothetical protein HDU98_010844 [Podochytrium sp. JEL0797]|nr:hypothetical protein HDU98_010844 [Podochytrium sp. JEL0797]
MESQKIAVLGSGVQGLTCALLLLHQGAKDVTIIGNASSADYDKMDGCFASPKAGANWQTYVGNDDSRLQEYDEKTYHMLWALSFLSECGIMRLPGFQFYDSKPAGWQHPWYVPFVKNFAYMTRDEIPPIASFGIRYDTVTMNVPKYMAWLTGRVKALGGKFVVKQLAHWEDALKVVNANVVVNCTGLGSLKLGGVEDTEMYPVRGQVLLVRAPQIKRTIGTALSLGGARTNGNMAEKENASKVTYVIPREDGTVILGGTYQKGNFDMAPDAQTSHDIMERCVKVCPDLVVNGKLPEIIEAFVGLRPARYGDCRLDSQYLKSSSGKEVLFVNNYGHGGYGYQSSWGCANAVSQMIRRAVGVVRDDTLLVALLKDITGPKHKL